MAPKKKAILWSGGIGDFLHYIVRISEFMAARALNSSELLIFIESTNPPQVESLFARCLPELEYRFVPKAIHWTKTNPLLTPRNEKDRLHRPAYRFVARDYEIIEDWFLPFLCHAHPCSTSRIDWLRESEPKQNNTLVIAARDKGFLWFPNEASAAMLVRGAAEAGRRLMWLGSSDEKQAFMEPYVTAVSVEEALRTACSARSFVGTDTGLATARELLGLRNLYCIDRYWYDELMIEYDYWTGRMQSRSTSRFAFDIGDLEKSIPAILES